MSDNYKVAISFESEEIAKRVTVELKEASSTWIPVIGRWKDNDVCKLEGHALKFTASPIMGGIWRTSERLMSYGVMRSA